MSFEKWLLDESKQSLTEWHENDRHHTLGGCFSDGDKRVMIHEGALRAIQNWCGNCTDPANGIDYYYDKRAMWAALNMIYQLIEEITDSPQCYEVKWAGEIQEIHIPKITSINYTEKR